MKCYGLTMPLITKADGTKFGKSESGTVWLDPEKTSPYELYQFLVNTEDAKVIDYLKKLTFLEPDEIARLEKSLEEDAGRKEAPKALAAEVVRDLHGEKALESALKITEALFRGKLLDLDEDQRREALKTFEVASVEPDQKLEDVLVKTGIAKSKREAREWTKGNSIMVNGVKLTDPNAIIGKDDTYVDDLLLIKRGKKNYYVLQMQETEQA